MYHRLAGRSPGRSGRLNVSPSLFRRHVEFLIDEGFSCYSVSQLAAAIKGSLALAAKPIVLTFDDGYEDFFTIALPTLVETGIPATLYVTTAQLNDRTSGVRRTDEPKLGVPQLIEVQRCGVEVGAHSHTHPQLDLLPEKRLIEEVTCSKTILEDALQRRIDTFAYPYGHYNRRVRSAVVRAGYTSACAVDDIVCMVTNDRFALPRLTMHDSITLERLDELTATRPTPLSRPVKRLLHFGWRGVRRLLGTKSPWV
jgi:peptidoglycan/xylan/chitin deacetylase (PgdA/CDA1 family)